ncbi:MAG TPA: PHP domain-containing protein, partial [Candidatus Goldiibacteriota bacterium]|nr:PHP domain-containing protein [Candidatus Goldiibacteriota bacterium]
MANYRLSFDNEATKSALLPLLRDKCGENIPDCVEFISAEFDDAAPSGTVKLLIKVNASAPAVLFDALKEYVEKQVKRPVRFEFLFGQAVSGQERVSLYWKFFAEAVEGMETWLAQADAGFADGRVTLTFSREFMKERICSDRNFKRLPARIAAYFGISVSECSAVSCAESLVSEKTPVRSGVEVVKKASAESEVLKDDEIKGEKTPLENVNEEGKYVVEGRIFHSDDYIRELKSEKGREKSLMLYLYITDEKDTIKAVTFVKEGDGLLVELNGELYVRAIIETRYDEREGDITARIRRMKKMAPPVIEDLAREKRVELHAHTMMSAMDSVMSVEDYIKTAVSWGHEAVAITDHGVVHSFPEAYNYVKKNKLKLKLIFGLEGYLTDSAEKDKSVETHHIILLVRNRTGLKNLYRLVSHSHIENFY